MTNKIEEKLFIDFKEVGEIKYFGTTCKTYKNSKKEECVKLDLQMDKEKYVVYMPIPEWKRLNGGYSAN